MTRAAQVSRRDQTVTVPAESSLTLRPSWRGLIHRWAVPVAVALTAVAATSARTGGARATVVIYGVCVTAMLAVSATYHHHRFADLPRRLLRRLDHSMILVGTAGTYTGVIVLGLDGATRVVLLVVAWAVAVAGVAVRMLWLDAPPGLIAAVYLVAGWQVLFNPSAYIHGLTAGELGLVAAGGVLYTAGAVVYARKRPNPWPTVFGYHEVFHTLVVVAALCHWGAVFSLAT